ncbi:MAG: shikimate kinase [Oscillospiraceae bacterium]|nr:shikimate kinase [Oscillospiraceae bacterium]
MSNIILIGMPASGKSTVGVILAKTLGVGFVDTDLIIQQREKRLLQDIINTDGIEKFLDCEAAAVKTLDCDNCVIATGGSVIFRSDAMEHLKKNGKIFYLDVPLPEIKKRLNNISTRGIAAKKGETVDDIFNERSTLYEKYADVILSLEGCRAEQTVEKICKHLK